MSVSFLPKSSLLWLAVLLVGAPVMLAQTSSSGSSSSFSSNSSSNQPMLLPSAPSPGTSARSAQQKKPAYADGGYAGVLRGHAACGGGLDVLQGSSQGVVALCGVGFTFIPYTATEIGGIRLQDGSAHFYVSEDFIAPITPVLKKLRGDPLGIVGYTKIVGDSNRFDYGIGWEHHVSDDTSIGLEVRDYLQFTNPVQHAVVLRLTLVAGGPNF